MNHAKIIKEHYIEPPITMIDNEYEKRQGRASSLGCAFEVKTKIWADAYLPEYRVAIPEIISFRNEQLEHWSSILPIETRYITYVPTGRVIYDNTKMHKEAVCYEYIYEPLLGKKDIK